MPFLRTARMGLMAVLAATALATASAQAQRAAPPLRNPVLLNMGFVCKWQNRCIKRQQRAMTASFRYLKARSVPAWKIRLCNRNSARGGTRKDWVGFNNCLRNPTLRPPATVRRRR